jgi:hypothetical protein
VVANANAIEEATALSDQLDENSILAMHDARCAAAGLGTGIRGPLAR